MEEEYLSFVLHLIDKKLDFLTQNIKISAEQVDYLLDFFADSVKEMDKQEVVTQQSLLANEDEKLVLFHESKQKLLVQKNKPYFARFDFVQDQKEVQKVYIGMANLTKDGVDFPVVCDWRAPISSMYYDFELGNANFKNDEGVVEGTITLKRQFKIENGKLLFYFDSSFMVMDDILQQELSQNVSNQMRSIIATIQKEQNAIIRSQNHQNLLVQGYAGSGKSAIAMHRVAFLLYRNKNLSSNQVMIISPNKMFSYYIGGVLPELGEKNIMETTFLSMAKNELGKEFDFETREQMIDDLLENPRRLEEAIYKEGFEFFENLKTFLGNFASMYFVPKDLVFGAKTILKQQIEKLYFSYVQKTPAVAISWIADWVVDELEINSAYHDSVCERVKRILYSMFTSSDILFIYQEFLRAVGLNELKDKIGYEDLAPLMLVKDFMFGLPRDSSIKHLVIDEMQDFSPIHFDIFEKMFVCEKTILGDVYQSLFKKMDMNYVRILAQSMNCQTTQLKKCYRSTKQIIDYASNLIGLKDVESVDRNGEEVVCKSIAEEEWKDSIISQIFQYLGKGKKVAIICPTQKHAEQTFVMLSFLDNISLVDKNTEHDETDVLVISTAFAKGLEFDAVIVLDLLSQSKVAKNLLYVACSRALHCLSVFSKK